MFSRRVFVLVFALALIAAACGDSSDPVASSVTTSEPPSTSAATTSEAPTTSEATTTSDATTTAPPASTAAPTVTSEEGELGPKFSDEGRTIDAPSAAIVVDGDPSDWDSVAGLDMTLTAISDERFPSKESTLKVAHDSDYVYVLLTVDDDYNWNPDDNKMSPANAIQWAIDTDAGEAMGATDEEREVSLGAVDIWHWELDCAAGTENGGAVSGPGEGKDPGNDAACNLDDEFSVTVEDREDDNGVGAENSLFGVWTSTAMVADEDGTWIFEMRRPLDTGDEQDAQFEIGSSARVAVAYWDPDTGPEGWKDEYHVQSANQGWITVNFV